jgi:hypothetical protein
LPGRFAYSERPLPLPASLNDLYTDRMVSQHPTSGELHFKYP